MLLTLTLLLIGLSLVVLGLAGQLYRYRMATPRRLTKHLELLRRIDRLVLDNSDLPLLAEKVVGYLPETGQFLGGMIRATGERGVLTILAVTEQLKGTTDQPGLGELAGVTMTAEAMQRSRSLTVQALNQRRVVKGNCLRDFECPPLDEATAAAVQQQLGIKGIVVYPVLADQALAGTVTFYFDRPVSTVTERDRQVMRSIADEVGVVIASARLNHQLADIDRRLQAANAQLQKADAAKDQFVSIVSHQLHAPLSAIKGYLSMLQEGDYGRIPAGQQPVISQLAQSTDELINLSNDLLSVSRINAGRFELSLSPARLEEIVREVVEELRPLAAQQRLKLVLELPPQPLGWLQIDQLRIRQVLINFIDNAIKYTEHGAVRISLKLDDDQIVCKVSDTGIGIPAAQQTKLFTKFYRADNARRREAVGSGLGLFVARQIVEAHQGSVLVESRAGHGSIFGFRLPKSLRMVAGPPQSNDAGKVRRASLPGPEPIS